jgi:hypothetical protein
MNSCDAKAQRLGFAALTPVERVVALVSRANFEIELGGFSSFYYNSGGEHAVETVAALEAVCAMKAAAALRNANAMFPGGPPTDRELRYFGLQQLGPVDDFGDFDREFYAENPDVFSRLCAFIDEHKAELAEHHEFS